MSKGTIKGLINEHDAERRNAPEDIGILRIGDLFGSAYFDRRAGRVERITIAALASLLAQRTDTPVSRINADIRRLLNIRRLDEMTMGGFEDARAHLAARIPD